jgi:hypothetical protein
MRRGRRLAALVVLVAAPFVAPGQVPRAQAALCAAGEVQVAVVVDFGDGGSVSSACVGAGGRDNGATVLAARASQLGTPAPRFNSSGLLCAIDGYPAEGCGEQTGQQYAYWSYWHGDGGGWDYSSVGPAGARVQAGIVEGWRFQPSGGGNPSDPPPRGSPDPASTCTPPATEPPPTEAPPAETAPVAPDPTAPVVGPSPTSGAAASTPADGSTTNAPADGSTTLTEPTSTTSTTAVVTASNAAAPPGPGPVQVTEDEGTGPPWGLLGGVAMIGGLGAAGAVVARRRGRLVA